MQAYSRAANPGLPNAVPPLTSVDAPLPSISSGPPPHSDMYLPQYSSHVQQHQPQQTQPKTNPLQVQRRGNNDWIYSLVVEQQPVRARMCGFGDKDRRPITPPPCIRLVLRDAKTNKELDYSDIDSSFFVLTVDLYDADATREVNLVRHAANSPTHPTQISTTSTTAYPPPPPPDRQLYQAPAYTDPYGRPILANPPQPYTQPQQQLQSAYYPPPQGYSPGVHPQTYNTGYTSGYVPNTFPNSTIPLPPMTAHPPNSSAGMFTRNLIGSLTVNASKLTDTNKKLGLWFVLQDLSVRTEGTFRLRMNFVDVGSGQGNGNSLNKGRAPVLAMCFSEPFQVYSAKKFPGVIESTPLSKKFAQQGIKIPIRKDAPKLSNQSEYDADDV